MQIYCIKDIPEHQESFSESDESAIGGGILQPVEVNLYFAGIVYYNFNRQLILNSSTFLFLIHFCVF